ncbi:MAG: NlpC/P60 family protein [Paludibacter sp.]|nr:NlpC/P60 family protein [Paludibacter sp.]
MKKLFFVIIVCISTFVNNLAQNTHTDTITISTESNSLADSIIAFGKQFLTVRYRSGGMSEKGFDCSGFTSYLYKNFGYKLMRTASGQAEQLDKVKKGGWQRGDLVFFNGRKRGTRIGHVGMVVDVNDDGSFDFIHASIHGVRITNSEQNYYKLRYMGAGRVIHEEHQLIKGIEPYQNIENISNNPDSQIIVNSSAEQSDNFACISVQNSQNQQSEAADIKLINDIIDDREKILHVVHQGDTLYSISKTYGCSIEQLRQWNNKQNNNLKIGEEILILN